MEKFDIVDADGHVFEQDHELYEFLEPPYQGKPTVLGFPLWPSLDGYHRGAIHSRLGIHKAFETSAATWIDLLDTTGIAATVLYPSAGLASAFIRDPDWAIALTRAYNNWLADRYLKQSPRLCGMALLPLQDIAEAVKELTRAVTKMGMLGAVLPAVGLSRPLGDLGFDPLYAEAERLGCALGVHGGPTQALGLERLEEFAQVHTLSHPIAQMVQVTSIVMGGVLDRFPKLRIAFLEAGIGWVPFLFDRMDRSYRGRKFSEYIGPVKNAPSTYLKMSAIYFGIDPTETSLAYASGIIGTDYLLYSSDFPHEANRERCQEEIVQLARAEEFSKEERSGILGGNARRFYAMEAACSARGREAVPISVHKI
ncbi:MAG TPA: amidohydrolase family protein [Candidatus Binataceae bacterium]|nr:amidohydrolase family protein [Candidatus Binataceae bacterium]